MTNRLKQPEKMPLSRYFFKVLILQGLQALKKTTFDSFFASFSLYFNALPLAHITKKRRNPYIFYVLEPFYFRFKN